MSALEAFNGHLYAGTANPTAGARIFRSQDGTTWDPVSQPGFGIGTDTRPLAIMDLAVFNQKLYASTGSIYTSPKAQDVTPAQPTAFAWQLSQSVSCMTPDGRYLQVEVTFVGTDADASPVLYDLTVSPRCSGQ